MAGHNQEVQGQGPSGRLDGEGDTSFQFVQLDVTGPVATLTIDRPQKLNALNARVLEEVEEAVSRITAASEVRCAVIHGAGDRAFVAGADIAELAGLEPLEAVEASRRGQQVFLAIERSRKPFVAAIDGFALGGGCELALACHLRVASPRARFGLPEVTLGIIPGYGGTARLPRLVGVGRALELILTGGMIDGQEAHRIGLVNRLVAEEKDVVAEARRLAASIAANAPLAVGLAIDAVTRSAELPLEEAHSVEATLFGLLAGTEDKREGMAAFLEKRTAEFTGR